MQNYKIALHKIALALLSLALFVGCIKPQKKSAADLEAEGADNAATFYAKEVSGKAFAGKVGTSWKVPVSTQFNLQVCVSDKRTQDDIRLNKFIVMGGEKDIHVRSDNNGCVNWTESLDFSILAQPSYVQITRQLRSEGLQTGQRVLKIGLNPWGSLDGFSNAAVIDLTKNDAPDGQLASGDDVKRVLRGLDISGKSASHPLSVETVDVQNINMNQGGSGLSMRTQVIFKPLINVHVTNENTIPLNVSSGKANIEVNWILVSPEGHKSLLASAKTSQPVLRTENRPFTAAFPLHIAKPQSLGTIELALKVTPVDAPENLGSFEGIFTLGDPSSIFGTHTLAADAGLSVADVKGFSVASYLSGTTKAATDESSPYALDHFKASDVHLVSNTSNLKTIGLSLTSCLRQSVGLSSIPNVALKVSGLNGKSHSVQTDDTGCFSWPETIPYSPFEADHSYKKTITVSGLSGFSATLPVRVDPWVYEAHQPAQVVVDVRDLNSSTDAGAIAATESTGAIKGGGTLNCASSTAAEVKLNGYTIMEQGRYYSSDRHLLLHSTQKVTMDLDASVLMPADRITQQRAAAPLNDGIYYIRMAVRLPSLGPLVNEEIGWSQQLARAEGGKLKSINFQFDVNDARAYGSRSQLYVEISPVDQAKVSGMALDKAILKYPNPSDLSPKAKTWSRRLFVAPYIAGGGQQMTSFQALDDLTNGKTMDSSSSNVTNSNLSIAGGQVMSDDFFASAKQVTNFEQLRSGATTIQQRRLKNILALEDTEQMKADLNAFAYDTSSPKNQALLSRLGLDKVNVDRIFHNQQVSRDDINALCRVWGHDLLPTVLKNDLHISPAHYSGAAVTSNCQAMMGQLITMDWLNFKAGSKARMPFAIEARMKLTEVGPTVQALGNNEQMTLMVGNSFNATYTQAYQGAWNVGAELGGGIGFNLGFIEAEAGAKTSAVRTQMSAVAVNNAQLVTAMSPLTVTKQSLVLQVHAYRPCVVASMSPAFDAWALSYLRMSGLNDQQALQAMSKKLMLCNAPIQKAPGRYLQVKENYYIVSTPMTDSTVEDSHAQDSRVWGQVIRGDADFANFLAMAQVSDKRGDVSQSLQMAIPSFIQNHTTMAMGHPGYYIMPDMHH